MRDQDREERGSARAGPGARGWALLNPEAGSCDDPEAWRERLASAGLDVRVPGSARETRDLGREAAREGLETLVVAGGDGTVHHAVDGLLAGAGPTPRLGVVPLGTGNDYARSLGLPSDPGSALSLLSGDPPSRRVDVVEIRGRGEAGEGARSVVRCVNVAVGGFGGEASRAPDREEKRHWGSLAYLRSALENLGSLPRYRTEITVDGVPRRDDLINVAVANGRFTAGGVPVAPRARMDDGRLRLVLIPALDLAELRRLASRVLGGEQGERIALVTDVRSLRIESEPPMFFRADGEQAGPTPLSLSVDPRRLEVIAPTPGRRDGADGD